MLIAFEALRKCLVLQSVNRLTLRKVELGSDALPFVLIVKVSRSVVEFLIRNVCERILVVMVESHEGVGFLVEFLWRFPLRFI